MDREPALHGPGVYPQGRRVYLLLALVAAACGGAPLDPESRASDGLVFVQRSGGSSELARGRIADGAVRALARTPGREEAWPYWSGPAQRVVFEASGSEPGARAELVLWDPRSGAERRLATAAAGALAPDSAGGLASAAARDERWADWAPERPALLFAFRGGEPASGLAVHDLASDRSRVVASGGERDFFLRPSWSPDGARIVAQRRGGDGKGSGLWVVEPDAGGRALTSDPAWFDWKPYFTRDGSEIVFSRRPAAGGPGVIAAIPAAGGAPRVVPLEPGPDLHSARPSPARDEIAFVAVRDGAAEVLLADLDGGRVRRLTRAAERQAFAPRWSPDGERVVVTSTPPGTPTPRLSEPDRLEAATVLVLDREGRALFEAPGMMPDWMPAWR